ncbi:COMT [Symbiodinium natans]|uniref:COMT protein n=1 Tax=Symbiodinium natans TaxID=878477 RepID=A0A812LVS9_9DINO|nr:COMT [Symbiodinium natans]
MLLVLAAYFPIPWRGENAMSDMRCNGIMRTLGSASRGALCEFWAISLPVHPQRAAGIHNQGDGARAAAALASLGAAAAASGRRRRCICSAADDDELGYGREDIGPGGEDPEGRYTWERCGMEVVVTAPVDEDVTKKDINASWSLRQASLSIRGEALFDGVPGCELDVDECFWEIDEDDDGNKKLMIHLAKKGTLSRWPDTLMKG